jgi:hypothetical protein
MIKKLLALSGAFLAIIPAQAARYLEVKFGGGGIAYGLGPNGPMPYRYSNKTAITIDTQLIPIDDYFSAPGWDIAQFALSTTELTFYEESFGEPVSAHVIFPAIDLSAPYLNHTYYNLGTMQIGYFPSAQSNVLSFINTDLRYLSLRLFNGPDGLPVSIVSMNRATDVPEPLNWVMMAAGFGLVGAAMRRVQGSEGRSAPRGIGLA